MTKVVKETVKLVGFFSLDFHGNRAVGSYLINCGVWLTGGNKYLYHYCYGACNKPDLD